MTRWVRFGLGAALVVAGAVLGVRSETPALAANPIISITPAQQTVAIGAGTVTFQVSVADVNDLAAYGFDIKFDHYVMEFQSSQNSAFLGSSGRQVTCDGLTFVLPKDPDTLTTGCATLGNPAAGTGVSGSEVLETLTFKLVGGGTSPLTFTKVALRNANEEDLCLGGRPCGPQDTVGGSITVNGPVLARPTPDPNATPTVPATLPTATPFGRAPAAGTTPGSGSAAGSTSATQPGAGGTPGAAASSGVSGANSSSGVAGAPSGGIAGADARPGSAPARAGSSGAPGAGGTGVGRFGDGPQSYARDGAGQYRNSAVAFAALGLVLIAAGVWRGGRGDVGSRG